MNQATQKNSFIPSFNTSEGDLINIILHIEQDAAEKVEEIEVKTEEEFLQEKNKEILSFMRKIDTDYNEKEKRTNRSSLVFESTFKNNSRLEVLNNKYSHVLDAIDRARQRLANKDNEKHRGAHREILRTLIMQGLCKLMEPTVMVSTRPEDFEIVNALLKSIEQDYEEATSLPVRLQMNHDHKLPKTSEGGVVLRSKDGTVSLDNTLYSRLQLIALQIFPVINQLLYGDSKVVRETKNLKRFPSYLPTVDEMRSRMEIRITSNEPVYKGIEIDKYSIGKLTIHEDGKPQNEEDDIDESILSLFNESEKK